MQHTGGLRIVWALLVTLTLGLSAQARGKAIVLVVNEFVRMAKRKRTGCWRSWAP